MTTFTILHTNDMHSNLVGTGPASEYTPTTVNDDATIGGIERIGALIAKRRRARETQGPVLVLDIGDFSMGTPFGGAFSAIGAELQCLAMAGYDATTFGNHEFDSGPDRLARGIAAAREARRLPAILAANTSLDADDAGLALLKELKRAGAILTHQLLERGGLRFGLFGIMSRDSIQFTINPGALTFPDPVSSARETARRCRAEGANVVICMYHGGVRDPGQGPITEGEALDLAREVPEIDVVVSGHTHTFMKTPVIVNGTPIVQAGCYGKAVGELVIGLEDGKRTVLSYDLHRIDDTILGDQRLVEAMIGFRAEASRLVFAPHSMTMDEPIVVIEQDWSNTFLDLDRSRPIGNLAADAIRHGTAADVALNVAGMVRAGLHKGAAGLQTAYDVFLLAPLGIGVADQSAGGSLVVAYLTGREIKNCLEFLLIGNPNLPGQYFPRVSGMRFFYDTRRAKLDWVTRIELGDLERGYREVDLSDGSKELYNAASNLYLGIILHSLPAKTKGALSLVPKKKDGSPLRSRADALPDEQSSPYILPPKGTFDRDGVVANQRAESPTELKEWVAFINYLKNLPTKDARGVARLVMDERVREDRSVKLG